MDIEWMGERGHMEPESEWLHFQVMLPLYFPRTPLKSLQLFGGNARQLIVEIVKRHGCDACMTWGGRQPSQTDSCGSSTKKIHYRGRQDTCMVHLCCKFYKAVDDKSTVQFAFEITFLRSHQHPKLHEEIKLSKSSERYQQVMLYVKWQEVEPRLYFSYDCSMIQSIVPVPLNSHGTVPKPQPQVDCVRVT